MKEFLNKLFDNKSITAWVFVLPAVLGIFLFIIIPIFCSLGLSFTKWDLLNPIKFVGFDNYKLIFSEPLFYKILLNTVVFALSVSVLG